MNEITLLSKEQVFGKQKIDVIKKMGTKCAVTDFAILLGAVVSRGIRMDDDNSLKGRTTEWYLLSSNNVLDVNSVAMFDGFLWTYANERSGGIRPVLPYADIPGVLKKAKRNNQGVLEVEYGEYPQYAPGFDIQRTLADEFSKGTLRKTGKTYTRDSRRYGDFYESFSPVEHEEFEYNGKKYVRVNSIRAEYEMVLLSNNALVRSGDAAWVEVSPITWYVDEESKLLISKNCLASGVRFCNEGQYHGYFKSTEMYMFLNEYFAREILPIGSHMEESARIIGEHTVDDEDFLEKFNAKTEQTLELLRGVQEELGVPKLPASKISEIKNENARLAAENETKRELSSILKELLELYHSQVALGGEIDEKMQALLNELSLQEAEELVNLVDSIVGLDVFSLDSDALSGGNDEKVYKIH
ncbi:MAG: hypothetical protein IKF82_03785 [Bacilli bacterium]|nr:hypothetical protein [Bacilli bacterium]